MKSNPTAVINTSRTYRLDFAQLQGISILSSDTNITVGTTDSLTYVTLATLSYTIDRSGTLDVESILFKVITNNDTNGVCKFQISGDGGTNFIDITGDIESGANLETSTIGLWISSVNPGNNKCRIRILGKSTDSNNTNIKINTNYLGNDSYGLLTINKT